MNLFRRNKNNEKEETVSDETNTPVGTTVDETVQPVEVPTAPVVDEPTQDEVQVQPLPEPAGPQVGSDVDEPEEDEAEDEQEVEASEPVPHVPGNVVAPEDTVLPTDVVPEGDYPSDGAVPHDTNDSLERIKESEDESNNPILEPHKRDTSVDRQPDESQAEYNERVPVAVQPVQPAPKYNYRGQKM